MIEVELDERPSPRRAGWQLRIRHLRDSMRAIAPHAACLMILAVPAACGAPPVQEPSIQPQNSQQQSWAAQWQQLRPLRGHFDAAPWNDSVDRWMGPKHRLMRAMAGYLLSERAVAPQIQALMGPPDAATSQTELASPPAVHWQNHAQPGHATLWWYRWRGTHDQLVLALDGLVLVDTGWRHALE